MAEASLLERSSSPATSLSEELLGDFFAALRPQVHGTLRTDAVSRALYATDASLYKMMPVGVLVPRTVADVQAAMELAARFGVPVLPRGGGSSLAGQTVATALVIDFSRHLDAVLEIDPEGATARVQPGLVLDVLSAELAPHGLQVGPDPASSSRATLGGMAANNATGTHSLRYGNMIHHVQAADVLLADGSAATFRAVDDDAWRAHEQRSGLEGRIYRRLGALLHERAEVIRRDTPKHWRRNSGYRLEALLDVDERNLAKLLCGSEGTLAVATELTVGLVPRPKRTALGIVHFADRDAALRATTVILETDPAAVELFDGVAIESTRRAPGYASRLGFVEGDPGAVLITEYYGETEAELRERLDELERVMDRDGRSYAVVRATTPRQIDNVWTVRKEGLGLLMGVKGDYKPHAFIEDASVPVEHLADYILELSRILEATDTKTVYYAHASSGTLHVRPFINTKDRAEVEKMRDIAEASAELVGRYGGSVSSEHGDGIVRGCFNEQLLGPELYQTCREAKGIFDPDNRLNPGKVVDAPAMTEHLRMGPDYQTIPFIEEMDWSNDGGFARAVELCNGNGACRKLQSGTMCPSYMVTRQEEDSTRGRANALRAALSGEVPHEELTGERLYEVLELCVQCKGCKTECPSNVDMAKMKTEWLSKYWAANGMPLRTRLFAHMPQLTRRISGTPLATVVNWMNRRPSLRRVMERTLGVTMQRPLPEFARQPFTTWLGQQEWTQPEEAPTVVLFADTFNNYNHPETARAAATFLHQAGYRLDVPAPETCCGRPLLSKGLVDEAQMMALDAVDALFPYADRGLPIVGLEPSCILTFTDELLALLPGDLRAQQVAAAAVTFEEFVAAEADAGRLDHLRWTDVERRVLLHGHCHQKALVGTGPSERCLTLPPGYTVETLDTSCCGMAGSFGYEEEHYDVSLKMAERRLAPAVRSADEDTLVAAAGTSCRAQLHDTTGRTACHPAEILLEALAS